MLRVPHMGLFWSTFISVKYLESQTYFTFCRTYCCILCRGNVPRKKNLTNLAHVYDFIATSICFPCGGKGFFPATLVITSWESPSAFLMCLRSQRDLKARRGPDLWKGWEQSFPIECKLNTSLIPTTGANDLPIASLRRLAHKQEDKSASTITRNTGGKSNQC